MMCQDCSGTGEGHSEYDGPCRTCNGHGEVPDICRICGESYTPDPDDDDDDGEGMCAECREDIDEMHEEMEDLQCTGTV